jgi:NAD(P)-dependent dehydrogenase (short-subunit alcohol dehydrogenase family)
MSGPGIRPLEGLAVVMTGSGRGIGAACARYAAGAGAELVLNDIDGEVLQEVVDGIVASGGRAVAAPADVSTWAGAGSLISRCLDEYGRIDGLFNNAGVVHLAKPWEQDEASFRRVVEVNLLGSAFCAIHAVKAMLAGRGGSIVNVASGAQAGWNLMGAYGASKGGVASLTYCWAMDLTGTNVRINAVSPVGETRLRDHFAAYLGAAYQPKPGVPPEVNAPVVAYLLSEWSRDLQGQVVRIDGQELSFVGHPSIVSPVVRRERWSFEDVCTAFESDLGPAAQPLGMVPAASMWPAAGAP